MSYQLGVDAVCITSEEVMGLMPVAIGAFPKSLMVGEAKTQNKRQLAEDHYTIVTLGP